MIRGKLNMCPFGLPITYGCRCAGGSIDGNVNAISLMKPVRGTDDDMSIIEDNWEHLDLIEDGEEAACPYADKIIMKNNAVDCKYDPDSREIPAGSIAFNGSPYYPHLYVGNTEDPGHGYPLEYNDDDNHRTIYKGLYGLGG